MPKLMEAACEAQPRSGPPKPIAEDIGSDWLGSVDPVAVDVGGADQVPSYTYCQFLGSLLQLRKHGNRLPGPPRQVSKTGNVTVRHRGRLHHIGVGNAYRGWRVILPVAGREIRILSLDGAPLRRLTLDHTTDYQPMP